VVCGYGRCGRELTADLRAEGLEVTVVTDEPSPGQGIDAAAVAAADIEHATGFVAATENDTTNLWLLEAARRVNPDVFLVSMQNRAANAPLFEAIGVDFGMVPAEVIAHEVLARIANPALMRFLPRVPHQGDEWSAEMVARLVERCGEGAPDLWRLRLDTEEAPALAPWLTDGGLRLGDLFRDPQHRERTLDAVPLALLGDGDAVLAPQDDHVLRLGDQLLIAGRPRARGALDATMTHEPTAAYVVEDRFLASGWLWRKLSGQQA
jgi:Trk K+ transport system NAD-binding subunit